MIINGEKIYLSSNYQRVMDKNTLTGLILIGAVVIAFMFLNRSNEEKPIKSEPTSSVSSIDEDNVPLNNKIINS